MFFAEAVETANGSSWDYVIPLVAVIASAFSVAYSLRFIMQVFFGPCQTLPREPHRTAYTNADS